MNYFLKLLFLEKYGRGTEEIKYLDDGVKNSSIILNHKTEIKPIHLRITEPELPEPDKLANTYNRYRYLSRNALLQ